MFQPEVEASTARHGPKYIRVMVDRSASASHPAGSSALPPTKAEFLLKLRASRGSLRPPTSTNPS